MESILRPFLLAHSEASRWHGLGWPCVDLAGCCDWRMPAYFSRASRACRDHGRLRMPGARIFLIVFPFRSNPCPSCSSKCAGLTVGLLGSGRDGSKEGEAGSCAQGDGPRQKRRRRLCYRNQEQGCVKRQRWHCFLSWDTEPRLAFRPAGPKGKVMQHTRPACGLQSGSSTVTTPRRSSKSARLRTSKTFNSSMSYASASIIIRQKMKQRKGSFVFAWASARARTVMLLSLTSEHVNSTLVGRPMAVECPAVRPSGALPAVMEIPHFTAPLKVGEF